MFAISHVLLGRPVQCMKTGFRVSAVRRAAGRTGQGGSFGERDMVGDGDTHSRTLWVCRGCRKGLCWTAGVVFSEAGCDEGRDMVARGLAGLNRPGEETGVLLAVRAGGCRVFSLDGVPLVLESEGGCSIVSS